MVENKKYTSFLLFPEYRPKILEIVSLFSKKSGQFTNPDNGYLLKSLLTTIITPQLILGNKF